MDYMTAASGVSDYLIETRRRIHRRPELSGQEAETAAFIRQELTKLNIPYEEIGFNTIGRLELGDGKKVAVRADIDALPIEEQTDVPWKSEIPGKMHDCGHDGHTAILLALAKLMSENRDAFSGTVYFCFQSGEERGLGAKECVEYLKEQGGVDRVMGLHLNGEGKAGALELQSGARAAGSVSFSIDIYGTGGHGARPDLTVNPLRIASEILLKISSIPSNFHDPTRACVVSPCMINGGVRPNIVPDTCNIQGTIRYFSEVDMQMIPEAMRKLISGTAAVYGGTAELTLNTVSPYPIVNDHNAVELGLKVAREMGADLLPGGPPTMMSDNFSEFQHEYPGIFWNLGCKSERDNVSGVPHTPNFDIDDTCLYKAVEFYLGYLLMYGEE